MSDPRSPRASGAGVVAVTGGAGFIGSAVIRRAAAGGREAVALVRECEVEWLTGGVDHRVVDWDAPQHLRNALAGLDPGIVVHCAGVSARSGGSVAALYSANVELTAELLEAVAQSCPHASVVLLSSAAVYGSRPHTPTVETAPLKPETHYAYSKAMTEMLGRAFARNEGMRVTVARPFNVLGPGEPRGSVVSTLLGQLLSVPAGQTAAVTLRETASVRDFVDVDDVADALLLIASRGEPGEPYNVCTGVGTSVADLVQAAGRALARELEVEVSHPDLRGTVSTGSPSLLRALGWSAIYSLEASLARCFSPAPWWAT